MDLKDSTIAGILKLAVLCALSNEKDPFLGGVVGEMGGSRAGTEGGRM